MDLGKKVFVLGTDAEAMSSIQKKIAEQYPSFKFKADQIVDRAMVEIIRWQPDLLLAETALGNITGLDLSEVLREVPACAGMSIMLMTNPEDDTSDYRSVHSGADLFIPKDEQLIEGIQQGIRQLQLGPESDQQLEMRPVNRVLVVDDSRTMRRIITTILAGIGIAENIQAEDGVDGLQKLNSEGADMVLVDYTMPRMNGLEMVAQVRKNTQFAALPIVVVTAEGEDEVDDILRAGANGYLHKPFTMQNLRDVMVNFASNLKEGNPVVAAQRAKAAEKKDKDQ